MVIQRFIGLSACYSCERLVLRFLEFCQEHLHQKVRSKYRNRTLAIFLQYLLQSHKNCSLAGQVLSAPVCFAWCSFPWPSRFASGSFIFSISLGRNESPAELHIVAAQWCMSVAQTIAPPSNYHGCCSEKTSCGRNSMTQWRLSNLHYHRVCCCLPCCVINSCVYH